MVITNDLPRFRVRVNDTEPIFYYSGAPGACILSHMMGVVNPLKNETLFGWSEKANDVDYQLTPGEPFSTEEDFGTSTISATPSSTGGSANHHVDDNSHGHGLSAGAVVGIAVGGTVVLILAIGAIYLYGRRGDFDKTSRKTFRSITVPIHPDTTPHGFEASSDPRLSQAADAEMDTLPGNGLMGEAGSQTTNQSIRFLYHEPKRHAPRSTTASTSFSRFLLSKMHFRMLPRSLGHKLDPSRRFKDLDNNEPLKEVCSNNRSSALWHFIIFHLPAVLVTTTLLVLHIKNIRWAQSRPTADELAALQFAAKVQESLILISLTDILLHRIRYGLLGNNGAPLGFLSSPFNLGFSLRYLVSQEFWSAMLNPASNRYFHGATAAMIFVFALLGLAAGPSSAIAMIPRYDWWQLSESAFLSTYSKEKAFIVERDPYPMKFGSKQLPGPHACFNSGDPDNTQTCVNRDLSPMLQELGRIIDHGLEHPLLNNITVSGPFRNGLDRPITFSVNNFSYIEPQLEESAFAVTPMDFVAHSLGEDVAMGGTVVQPPQLLKSEALTVSGKEKWKQPLVAVHCENFDWRHKLNKTSAKFVFDDILYNKTTVSLDLNNTLKLLQNISINDDDGASRPVASLLLDIQHLLPVPITATILLAYPDGDWGVLDLEKSLIHSYLCLVQARWVEAEVFVHPRESLEVQSHLGFPTRDAMDYIRRKPDSQNTIKVSLEWLRGIGVPPIPEISTFAEPFDSPPESVTTLQDNPAFRQGINMCTAEFRPTCIPAFLAVYLANAMSRFTQLPDYGSRSPQPNSTVIFNTWFDHVYAYGIEDSATVPLAFTALLLQAFIALIHFALTVFARQPWHCSTWGNFGQLLPLALRSNPSDELRNVGAGVQNSRTWKLMTVVREVGQKRQLEMVITTPTSISRQGQTNTNGEERGATQMKIPQVGIKYG
ncbi:hypothetical protein BFJ69_g17193 [Fusarium oxysporum]|uniref:Uncharacterized protein n=1 Tax=Fusarium oxysporum TaxID=5507 RepID=A0A420M8Y7_FUSOX|nr:hypothetical protein BFJ69_g17193 [Fusarium oxysporum]